MEHQTNMTNNMQHKREQAFISEFLKTKLAMVFCGLLGNDKEKGRTFLFYCCPRPSQDKHAWDGQFWIMQVITLKTVIRDKLSSSGNKRFLNIHF